MSKETRQCIFGCGTSVYATGETNPFSGKRLWFNSTNGARHKCPGHFEPNKAYATGVRESQRVQKAPAKKLPPQKPSVPNGLLEW